MPFDGPLLPPVRPPSQPPLSPPGPVDSRATTFVPVHTGKFDDPALSGFTTYAYRVDAPTDWTNSDMQVLLTSGTLNHVQPELFGSEAWVNGLGDSSVFAPTLSLGDLAGGFQGQVGIVEHVETPTELTTSWFTTDFDNLGTFDIAMITLSDDANGTLAYRTIYGSLVDNGPAAQDRFGFIPDFNIVNGQIVAIDRPEPPTLPEPPVIPGPPTPPDPPTNPPVDPPVDPPKNPPTNPPTGPTTGPPTGPPTLPDAPTGSDATSTLFVPIETGEFDNPNLEGFTTFAMRVTATTDWTNADLEVTLTEGTLSNIESSGFGGGPEAGPQGLGDTAVFGPTTTLSDITGGPSANTAIDHTETSDTFRSSWFNTDTTDIGTFDIAMITLSHDANGVLNFRTIAGANVEEGGYADNGFSLIIRDGQIIGVAGIPEPSGIALLTLGLAACLSCRWQRCIEPKSKASAGLPG